MDDTPGSSKWRKKPFRAFLAALSPYTQGLGDDFANGVSGCLGPLIAIYVLCCLLLGVSYSGGLIGGLLIAVTLIARGGAPVHLISYHVERTRRRAAAEIIDSPTDVKGDFTLYLRTFRTDRKSSKLQYSKHDKWRGGIAYTEEELLCSIMGRAFGKVVALGRCGETLPEVGASRMYATDERWKGWVADLASRARRVMIQLNEGEHTEWELRHVAKNVHRSQVVLLVPRKMHEPRFLEILFNSFSTSPSLLTAYAEHCVALQYSGSVARRQGTAKQSEYFSIICFDGDGIAYRDTVKWAEKPISEQNLVEALALNTVFRLSSMSRVIKLRRGLGRPDCCNRSLVKSHSRMYCKKSDEQCQEATEEAWKLHCHSLGRFPLVDPCCPRCRSERKELRGGEPK
ncbi:hypothetical protein OHA53_34915 [Streptomyces althioticus]|uniref:hypothetical protein n=1 Tax=Streptomyces althioticus TaxID=83380 RepID=UPI0038736C11|nr:hypothetical protein OHA53_34915 [Streptomyces althioticus]